MPLKVLIIEDDRDIIDVLEYVLKDDGHEVLAFTNSKVLAEVEQIQPELILLDEWLGEEQKGSDLCRKLKLNPSTASIPVMMLSAVNPIELIMQEALADDYIKKPFDIDDLSSKVRQFEQDTSLK
ncbi:response regulator [Mucilaginibacter lacusdianchii]|uniref:response regulator n=1 Tax=Mucilaginibacter lacusdianchii TaxID=2684211 RepID=UPI00131DAC2C|nr:response regulator [Mucilaginibacter sp. JXJ CY 39]